MLIRIIKWLFGSHRQKAVKFKWRIGPVTSKERNIMLEVVLTNEEKVQITLTPVTKTGKPAKLDGNPTWSVTTGDATLDVAPDGLSAFIISPDLPGESLVNIEADADLGAGVVTIAEAVKVTVNGALAVSLGAIASPPVPK